MDRRELSDPFVQMMRTRFDTYTEYSSSGNGIHILRKLDKERLPIYYDEKKPIITKTQIIKEFVEKIIVYKAERVDGHRVQKIKII